MDYTNIIKEIKKIIAKFLKQHGGYSNGLDTYVNGTVRFNSISALDWKTPGIGNMTLKEHHNQGFKLAQEIAGYLKKIDFKDWVYIKSNAADYGCYYTSVSIHIMEDLDRSDFE